MRRAYLIYTREIIPYIYTRLRGGIRNPAGRGGVRQARCGGHLSAGN